MCLSINRTDDGVALAVRRMEAAIIERSSDAHLDLRAYLASKHQKETV